MNAEEHLKPSPWHKRAGRDVLQTAARKYGARLEVPRDMNIKGSTERSCTATQESVLLSVPPDILYRLYAAMVVRRFLAPLPLLQWYLLDAVQCPLHRQFDRFRFEHSPASKRLLESFCWGPVSRSGLKTMTSKLA